MEELFVILAWLFLAIIVFKKQYNASLKHSSSGKALDEAILAAIAAPATIFVYMIRAVFFEDWI